MELTGDTEGNEKVLLRDNSLIVTTPEKWDAVTRKMKDDVPYMEMIRLVLVSER